jgi:hypothetical protein
MHPVKVKILRAGESSEEEVVANTRKEKERQQWETSIKAEAAMNAA